MQVEVEQWRRISGQSKVTTKTLQGNGYLKKASPSENEGLAILTVKMTLSEEAASQKILCKACVDVLKARLKKSGKRYKRHHLLRLATKKRQMSPNRGLLDVMGKEIQSAMGELSKEMLEGKYSRTPLSLHRLRKPDGGTRYLMIHGRLEEKIVERAVYLVIANKLRAALDTGVSFCGVPAEKNSKKKLGIFAAHKSIAHALKARSGWVLKADIEKFFDRLNRGKVLDALKRHLPDKSLEPFFADWVNIKVKNPGSDYKITAMGIPQGSCLSGLIANLYLTGFDTKHQKIEGVDMFRYADDLLFVCKTEAKVKSVEKLTKKYLKDIGLNFKEEKFDIYKPKEPFYVLGYQYDIDLLSVTDEKIQEWICALGEEFSVIGKIAYRKRNGKPMRKRDIDSLKSAQDKIWDRLIAYSSIVTPHKQTEAVNRPVAHQQAYRKMIPYLRSSVAGINRIANGKFMKLPEFRVKGKYTWPYFVPRLTFHFPQD